MIKKLIERRKHTLEAYWLQALHGAYGKELKIIAITGTTGKTSTAIMVHAILQKAGYVTGLVSTSLYSDGLTTYKNEINVTTPSAKAMRELFKNMQLAGCEYAVIEVSAHALRDKRIKGLHFNYVAITNIYPDHLEDFKDLETYARIKLGILNYQPLQAFMSRDSEWYEAAQEITLSSAIVSFGINNSNKYALENIRGKTDDSNRFTIKHDGSSYKLKLNVDGDFQQSNALLAFAITHQIRVVPATISDAIEEIKIIPGRLEKLDCGQDFNVYIDYAHNGIEFEHVLRSARKFTAGRIITVFGAAGEYGKDRWTDKGRVAGDLSDIVIVTDDEPGAIDPKLIREHVAGVASSLNRAKVLNIAGRQKAIVRAFTTARAGDTVLILSLGDQSYRLIGDTFTPWDDRLTAKKQLDQLTG